MADRAGLAVLGMIAAHQDQRRGHERFLADVRSESGPLTGTALTQRAGGVS